MCYQYFFCYQCKSKAFQVHWLCLNAQQHVSDGNRQRAFPAWVDSGGHVLTGQMLMRLANPYQCACIPTRTHARTHAHTHSHTLTLNGRTSWVAAASCPSNVVTLSRDSRNLSRTCAKKKRLYFNSHIYTCQQSPVSIHSNSSHVINYY